MPAYKYTLKSGKTLWYANFYYTDWTGEKKHICKRGFKTQREAKEYEKLQSNVVTAARRGYVDLIIEPADTRKYLVAAFEMLYTKCVCTPDKKHGTK